MKKTLPILLAALACSQAFAGADNSKEFKAYLNHMLPKLDKAFETKDMKFFETMSTPDFTESEMGHKSTKKEAMGQMKMQFGMTKSMRCHFKLLDAKASGNTGTAKTYGHAVMVTKPDPKGKTHTMVMDMWESETWVKSAKGWKIKTLEQAKPPKMTMDGKPYDPTKAPG